VFIENSSVKGVRGFLKHSSTLRLDFSLEDLSCKLICNDRFFHDGLPKFFWDKRVLLFKTFPCLEALKNHLIEMEIIKDPLYFSNTRCISEGSHDFLTKVSGGGMYVERSFFKVLYICL